MSRREAERLQEALQQSEQGITVEGPMVELVKTARQVADLAEPVPNPPFNLAPGRQRLLTEAARLRSGADKTGPVVSTSRGRAANLGAFRLATILAAAVLVIALLFGAGQVAADSLPGEPLYGLKLALEEAQLMLASGADARADLTISFAVLRLDEVLALAGEGRAVDDSVRNRVENQLVVALQAAVKNEAAVATRLLTRFELALARRLTAMDPLAGVSSDAQVQAQLQQLVRVMERVRFEAHAGQGDPESLRERLRTGLPAESEPSDDSQLGPASGLQPTAGRDLPGPSADPMPTEKPAQEPVAQPSEEPRGGNEPRDPANGPGPNQTEEPKGDKGPDAPDKGPRPKPVREPDRPDAPGKGSGSNPAQEPIGSSVRDEPGHGPGASPAKAPAEPMPPPEPDKDSDSGDGEASGSSEDRGSQDAAGQGPTEETPGNGSPSKEGQDTNSDTNPAGQDGPEKAADEPEPMPDANPEPQPSPEPSPNPQPTPEPKSDAAPSPDPDSSSDLPPNLDPEPSPDPDASPSPEPSPDPSPDPSPSPEGPGPGPSGDAPRKP